MNILRPKKKRRSYPRRMPGDSDAFNEANALLERLKAFYYRPSLDQLKIGDINYYPNTGTIKFDREKVARCEKGLEALEVCVLAYRRKMDGILAAKMRRSQ